MSRPVLEVKNLSVAYRQGRSWLAAIRDISLQVNPGQIYGIVGESGSGKTTLAMAIMRYLGDQGRVTEGEIFFEGQNLLEKETGEMEQIWGDRISLVPQNPLSSLNPSMKVGVQVGEILSQHLAMSGQERNDRVQTLLRSVHLPDPLRVAGSYPHQLSGGMQQRVLIAMALAGDPRLLILDEPTTSLDVTTQASILDLIQELISGMNLAVLYVSHNLGVVAQMCDRVAVLYAGELVEDAPLSDLFQKPLFPYTHGLLKSIPKVGQNKSEVHLEAIPGKIPPLGERPAGCVFIPRCPLAIEQCHIRPPLYQPEARRLTRCHRWQVLAGGAEIQWSEEIRETHPEALHGDEPQKQLLDVEDLRVGFTLGANPIDILAKRPRRRVNAVDGVSLRIPRRFTLGLVGESGSGKTTLARAIVGLVERDNGKVEFLGIHLPSNLNKRSLETLRNLQMVFQNPDEALNPYLTVGDSLRRPLVTLLKIRGKPAIVEVERLLQSVGLPPQYANRYPGQLSGGEKQRVAIARAFASSPDLLIADEPVSALDVSVQAAILNLLHQLQVERDASLLFISHDLSVVGYLADAVAVMYLGSLMEITPASVLFQPPHHPYTEALLSAIPNPEPGQGPERIRMEGELPSPTQKPGGCPFHTRCPRFLGDICVQVKPPWRKDPASGKRYFCHIPVEELVEAQSIPTGETIRRKMEGSE